MSETEKYYDFPFYTEDESDAFHDYFVMGGSAFMHLNSNSGMTSSCEHYDLVNATELEKYESKGISESSIKVDHPLLEATTYVTGYKQIGIYYTGDAEYDILVKFKDRPAIVILHCNDVVFDGEERHYEILTGRDLAKDNAMIERIGLEKFDKFKNKIDDLEKNLPGISQFIV